MQYGFPASSANKHFSAGRRQLTSVTVLRLLTSKWADSGIYCTEISILSKATLIEATLILGQFADADLRLSSFSLLIAMLGSKIHPVV